MAGQTPPGARPNRGGQRGPCAQDRKVMGFHGPAQEHSRSAARVGRVRRAAMYVPEEWPSHPLLWKRVDRTRLTGRLALLFHIAMGGALNRLPSFEPNRPSLFRTKP
ncbi:Hypothetical protein GbCGDNIH2_0439 [Granulibacter bethesdensis]|uniref:Uncharacterized protein n=2 Tax=Granulibacter bethesdensis TaxID=364410 RepID=Q0BV15_GRABC|nr:Hypothetical protein GbCGDNIH1_0439 [Granulibacter bethesdensis CGDNIH1]AHJ67453.1 Hypothetical protein GbCGDNIH2_0439 [Granulibacter bethesdensis]APH51124.1 Hypothetical protein GbCGDNIH5_0439 [Granulibacter bethesdensis]APH58745.1 Hypothetical protein GbCGDNIH7_0439 [Granulibacter bethesdensis]APH63818.1 Hypothetical protein GbCGDNIH1I4_0439 [Granulibacter bethesdensis]